MTQDAAGRGCKPRGRVSLRLLAALAAWCIGWACNLAAAADGLRPGDVQPGPWHCVGPFKDALFGNLLESFRVVFAPEQDALAGAPDLAKVYQALALPGLRDTRRAWSAHPEWADGYRNLLPKGPSPARNETVYLHRTLTAARAGGVTLRIYAEDCIGVWLNGAKVGEAIRHYGPSHCPTAFVAPLQLAAGENRLLVKITSLFGKHGFACALDGLTPGATLLPLQVAPELITDAIRSNFHAGDQPIYAETGPVALPPDSARLEARLRRFRCDVTMLPMFDPQRSALEEARDQLPPSDGGRQYLEALASIRPRLSAALAAGSSPAALADGNNALETLWRTQVAKLPPILFIRCPAFGVNAIAPYASGGATPAGICLWDPAEPNLPARVIFSEAGTALYDMNLSYDAKTIFFSARRKGVPGGWHLYEIGVDGQGLKPITAGDCSDISPAPLPDGRLIFVSTRARTWVQCQGQPAGLLYTCRRDGGDVRRVSANIDSDHAPAVMDDGRVLFTRWDYGVEKNVFARHALWTMNPDGTGFRLYAGNTKEDPAGFWEARQIPGRPEVVCAFGPHHSYHAGMAGLVWDRFGPEAPRGSGFRFLTTEVPAYGDTTLPYGYQHLFPLNERLFLVSYGGDGGQKNRLYLLDDRGNRKCLYEAAGNLGCWRPLLLAARPAPPVIPSRCENPEWTYREPEEMNQDPDTTLTGTLLVQDVYAGLLPDVARGEAKYIQVIEQVPKSRCMADGEAWGHTPIISRGTVHVRREIGLVKIEADGSAHFTAPALRSLSLNVLDASGKTLMRMGSDMHVMPGERQGCIGCHENRHGHVAPGARTAVVLAAARPPENPAPPAWGTRGIIDYQKVVQPVWDKYCVSCHGGAQPKGHLDLTGDRTRFFCMSYDNLVERGWVDFHQPFAGDHDENAPKNVGALASRLCGRIDTAKHCGRELSWEERRRVYAWIDANVPYYGTYDYRRVRDEGGQLVARGIGARDSWQADPGNRNPDGWLKAGVRAPFLARCLACHKREVYNGGFWGFGGGTMDRTMTVSSKLWTDRGLNAHMFSERYGMSQLLGPELRLNLTRPANSALLQAPLAASAGGWGLCRLADGSPVFKDKSDPDYQRMLLAIETGKANLYHEPRIDMDEAHVAAVLPTVLPEETLAAARARFVQEALAASPMKLSGGLKALGGIPPGCRNLAPGATASGPDPRRLDGAAPRVSFQGAIDANPETLWDELDGQKEYRLALAFPAATRLSALRLTGWGQHDFAPKDFILLADGREIGRVGEATYDRNRLTLAWPPVTCRTLELAITGCYGGSPAIRELELYDATGNGQ